MTPLARSGMCREALKVLVTHPVIAGGLEPIEQHQVVVADGPTPSELRTAMADVDALLPLLTVPVDAALLAAAPRLKVVANHAVGYDNIDLPACTRRGVWVTNTPGVLTEATADLAWAALLAAARQIVPGDAMVRGGRFEGWEPTMLLGVDMVGKTLGVVGFGQIGQAVARRAAGFSVEVLFHDVVQRGEVSLGGLVTARQVPLEQLLQRADFVSLHVPLSTTTHHLMDSARLALMKPTAFLINTARGPVVDEAALVEHLRARRIAGAALDVYEQEPALAPGLAALDNALLLPHIGSATAETRLAMARMAARNIAAVLRGAVPPNAVNEVAVR